MKKVICILLAFLWTVTLPACQKQPKNGSSVKDPVTTPATADVSILETFPQIGQNVRIECVEGTAGCYSITDDTILFSGIQQDSLYSISGEWNGNIVIDVGEDHQFELEMRGFILSASEQSPITILSGDKVTLTAKKGYENSIYDQREEVQTDDETVHSGAIYAECDLTIGGKGSLTVISANNNGIRTKDDLEVKNLNLMISCMDNALKGKDSVQIYSGTIVLIARKGDGIKTTNSNISEKGNQRGTVTLSGCNLQIFAACDGIDAAYDVVIEDESTVVNIFTDKYSEYSQKVDKSESVPEDGLRYIRFHQRTFQYAVKYYNSDSDYLWIVCDYHSSVSGGRNTYYYYAFPIVDGYSHIQYFGYTDKQVPGQEEDYAFCSDYLSINTAYDTFVLSQHGNSLRYSWGNYTTNIQDHMGPGGMGPGGMGPGGMQEGNPDKGEYSTKGIKAANEINILAGMITIKSYDDAIHANQDTVLENFENPTGNITISGGKLTIWSDDDGIHADGDLRINNGELTITHSYEGLEGETVHIADGDISIFSLDDGVNATATSGEAITVSGGTLYILAGGDGMDSNSTTNYQGIIFSGGNSVIIANSNGNSAIDTERGYQHTGGYVLAVTSRGGMSHETANCKNLQSVGIKKDLNLTSGKFLQVTVDSKTVLTVKLPCTMAASVVFLGDPNASITSAASTSAKLDGNGVSWAK